MEYGPWNTAEYATDFQPPDWLYFSRHGIKGGSIDQSTHNCCKPFVLAATLETENIHDPHGQRLRSSTTFANCLEPTASNTGESKRKRTRPTAVLFVCDAAEAYLSFLGFLRHSTGKIAC